MYSDRILKSRKSFIREILKVLTDPEVISFAGGLPNPSAFPIDQMHVAIDRALVKYGSKMFQYATTEGLVELKELICERYKKRFGFDVKPEHIMLTNGSQQALDLLGKILLNKDDQFVLERPGYLGAIQVLTMYEAEPLTVPLLVDGLDIEKLDRVLRVNHRIKLMYTVPNFQNPTGLTYSLENRKAVREVLKKHNVVLIEDDPYGELRFTGETLPYIGMDHLKYSVLLGSFSKTLAPGMRLGYVVTKNNDIMSRLIMAKQAADLHTSIFTQYAIREYLLNNSYDDHINGIIELYRSQAHAMLDAMDKYFPKTVEWTRPEGGMFMWAKTQPGTNTLDVFKRAMEKKVAFVPGFPFYANFQEDSRMRLNFTSATPEVITEGIRRLASAF